MRKVLMHVCCAPCFIVVEEDINKNGVLIEDKRQNVELTAFWYNPNIHPLIEYKKRLETFRKYCNIKKLESIIIDEYDMDGYVKDVVNRVPKEYISRCEYCYTRRLEMTFEYASNNGYDYVSTTLTRSPYQNHDIINKVAEELSVKYNVKYLYLDYRHTYYEGQRRAKEYELYMQKYCGCIFSIDSGKWGY